MVSAASKSLNAVPIPSTELAEQALRLTVLNNPFIPHTPTVRQAYFLSRMELEAFYGGAGGGGKSDALLMAALQFVHVPGYAAMLLRKTFKDLQQPNALMPRAMNWLGATSATMRDGGKEWVFPSGAVLKFGYLDTKLDKYQYQSAEFQFIGFDELTHFQEDDYRYMFSRLRRLKGVEIPIRMRSASNPGGVGHEWVKRRMIIEGRENGRIFVKARIPDNPHLDANAYHEALSHLDPVTRKQIEDGDWSIRRDGGMFRREWFGDPQENVPMCFIKDLTRYWDLAATSEDESDDPDWTAGALLGRHDGRWWVLDVRRFRETPATTESIIRQTANMDGPGVRIRMEQEGGASGKSLISHYARNVLSGFDFKGWPALKDKVTRAGPFSAATENRLVSLARGQWNSAFLDEVEAFPTEGVHDDQVDACTGAMAVISGVRSQGGSAVKRDVTRHEERMRNRTFDRVNRRGIL